MMAATIAHIFCALSLLNSNALHVDNIAEFIIGTCFPDIRYLGVVKRTETHAKNVTWNDVINAITSFEKGRLLHSLLDEKREEFIEQSHLYDLIPDSLFRSQVLKFYEDIILYEKIHNWQEIAHYFDIILDEETNYGIAHRDLRRWHDLLKDYVLKQPDTNQILFFLKERTNISMEKEKNFFKRFFIRCRSLVINQIAYFKLKSTMNTLKENQKLKVIIESFYQNINKFLVK